MPGSQTQGAQMHETQALAPRALSRERWQLAWDGLIVMLVVINLGLLLFDTLYLIEPFQQTLASLSPSFDHFYATTIHARFYTIDLVFVSIFVLDVLLGWVMAIVEKRYHRWFFYPFVHWYDVLGCIPLGGLRWLRALRIISLLYRLQRLSLIDMRRWYLVRGLYKYYGVLLEEVSDRVAIRLLGSLQEEIRHSNHLSSRISKEILAPRKTQLVDEIVQRLHHGVSQLHVQNRDLLTRYINALVTRTLYESPEIKRLHKLPMGQQLTRGLDQTLSRLAAQSAHELLSSMRSPECTQLMKHAIEGGLDSLLHTDERSDRVTEEVMVEMLALLKEQVATQRWKQSPSPHPDD
ncbi:ion transporter [Terasakiispira papahanaumokuakeensis]|nr:ion transporter [Terasakiispira papahanaumokuakeensis]